MQFAPYIVGFLDLLGFSAEILREEEDPSHLMGRALKFKAMQRLAAESVARLIPGSVEMRWLSDTCVFARHISNLDVVDITEGLRQVSVAMGVTQCRFASEDYFSRGGIEIGRMLQTVNMDGSHGPGMATELFGAGVVRAAELEQVVARQPRVVVSARLVAPSIALITQPRGRSIYRRESIELPYIDYLSFAEAVWPERPDRILAGHAELVHNLVIHSRHVPSLQGKAAWLLQYHNWHVASRGALDRLILRLPSPDESAQEPAAVAEGESGSSQMALRLEALQPIRAVSPEDLKEMARDRNDKSR